MVLKTTVLLLLCAFVVKAQQFNNLSAVQQGNDVLINYSLDADQGKAYSITLYASHNDFATPLRLVQGDVGAKRVLTGGNKTITWRALDELKNFDGEIHFEVRAVPAPPLFTKITSSSDKVKRGKQVTITWAGGSTKEQVALELVKEDLVVPLTTTENNGRYIYDVPKKMKKGVYSIHLRQSGEITIGSDLAVKPKIPLGLKLLPLVAIGAGVALMPKSKNESFPEPPDLTR